MCLTAAPALYPARRPQGLYARFGVEMYLRTREPGYLAEAQSVMLEATRYFSDGSPEVRASSSCACLA